MVKRTCRKCTGQHELYYFVHYKNQIKHLVMDCPVVKAKFYLPFEDNLNIMTKLSRGFFRDKKAHCKEQAVNQLGMF